MQVEREVAKKLFEYIFPGVGGNAFEGGGFSPFMVKNMLPTQEEEDETEDISGTASAETPRVSSGNVTSLEDTPQSGPGSGPGSLEHRLHPTLHLTKHKKAEESRGLGISNAAHKLPGFSLFQHSDKARPTTNGRSTTSRQALTSTNSLTSGEFPRMSRSPSERSVLSVRGTAASRDVEKSSKRTAMLHRSHSDEKKKKKDKERSDDLTQMMNRASNYMTLSFVKVPSMVLCLSYKGQGKRNIEDVHDLVFRMPTLEYRNKTWSNLDLALQLKKDLIRALVSHAGAIVSNKFSHHKPSRLQASRLREIVNTSAFGSPNGFGADSASETSSLIDSRDAGDEMTGRPSTASARPSTLNRSISLRSTPASSTHEQRASDHERERASDGLQDNGHSPVSSPSQLRPRPMSQHVETSMSNETATTSSNRGRAGSIGRHFSGFGDRLRQRSTLEQTTSGEEAEDNTKKSRLLLGGQKLLRTLRDQ